MNSAKIPLTRLYRKVSARSGEQYFVGRLGSARVLLFKDREQPAEGDEVFSLLIEAVDDPAPGRAAPPRQEQRPPRRPTRAAANEIEEDALSDFMA
jgi:hypothetical protein